MWRKLWWTTGLWLEKASTKRKIRPLIAGKDLKRQLC